MANLIQWGATGTSRSTGIAAADNLANGAGLLSSEVDNSTILDRYLICQGQMTPEAAGTTGPYYLYILYAVDGTNYEDGGTSAQPSKAPAAVFPVKAAASAQKVTTPRIEIEPYKFKLLYWNACGQQCDANTLLAYTYNEEIQ
jgi:hypothetical protein